MPYLEELLSRFIEWEITTSIVWGAVGFLLWMVGMIGAIQMWRDRDNYDFFGDPEEGCTWAFIFLIFIAIIGVSVLLTQCFDICEVVYLPEITIYNYIDGLISQ